ncbi:copper chaperone PCu(A)C [Kibdelosporangium aridum]|uniref:Copper chaperone PCu(A)C n=1 Tax=Kibdelosporangium aridum TaxID=2030 RepID=A0A428ZB11_KIBAR|nr:copper chaperone PCu(A)C [Kibdelosporangium aridum]RSM85267.1 copper chaperone PCu(A)C [Kibdelosporangium aridum]
MKRYFVVAMTVLPIAAGCGSQGEIQSGTIGTNGQIGPILVRNMYVEAPRDGSYASNDTGRLRLWLFNTAANDDRLTAVRSDAVERTAIKWDRDCAGTFETPAGLPLPAGDAKPQPAAYFVELTGFNHPVLAGTTIPVFLTFENAGQGRIDAMVEASHDGDSTTPPSCSTPSPPSG